CRWLVQSHRRAASAALSVPTFAVRDTPEPSTGSAGSQAGTAETQTIRIAVFIAMLVKRVFMDRDLLVVVPRLQQATFHGDRRAGRRPRRRPDDTIGIALSRSRRDPGASIRSRSG